MVYWNHILCRIFHAWSNIFYHPNCLFFIKYPVRWTERWMVSSFPQCSSHSYVILYTQLFDFWIGLQDLILDIKDFNVLLVLHINIVTYLPFLKMLMSLYLLIYSMKFCLRFAKRRNLLNVFTSCSFSVLNELLCLDNTRMW